MLTGKRLCADEGKHRALKGRGRRWWTRRGSWRRCSSARPRRRRARRRRSAAAGSAGSAAFVLPQSREAEQAKALQQSIEGLAVMEATLAADVG